MYLSACVCPWMRSRACVGARRTASVRMIELPPWNVTVPPPMYTAPPSYCAHHPVRYGPPLITGAAAREPERSHICARVGDRRAVEHERALGHGRRPSVACLHTRGRRCDRCPAKPGMARTCCGSLRTRITDRAHDGPCACARTCPSFARAGRPLTLNRESKRTRWSVRKGARACGVRMKGTRHTQWRESDRGIRNTDETTSRISLSERACMILRAVILRHT
jgi:hypothetical protein